MNTSDPSLVNYVHPEAAKVRADLDLMADLLAGTRRMWERSAQSKYIRKWADEKQATFDIRRQSETVFEGLARVLSACVGMLFAKPPAIVWNQSEVAMEEHWDNLDGKGTAGPVLVKRFTDHALRDGLAGALVDHPTAPAGVTVTAANEVALNLRPTWALYTRRQFISWRTERVANVDTLTQVVLEECLPADVGAYGTNEAKQYRVLRLSIPQGSVDAVRVASWELWKETRETGQNGFVLDSSGIFRNRNGQPADRIPLRIAYTGRTENHLCATVPLLGVAWANLSHWQLSTNLRFYRDLCAFPQPVVVGELAQEMGLNGAAIAGRLRMGPAVAVHLTGVGSSFEWKAPPTEGFAPLERGVAEKLQQIGQMGMSFMVTDTRAAETAEAKRLDATAENSTLATAAQGIQDAVNGLLQDHAWYLGIAQDGAPSLTISKDFSAAVLDGREMVAYVDAVSKAGLPPRLLLEAWQQGGRIPEDTDLDALEMEMMANAAGIAAAAVDAKAAAGGLPPAAGAAAPAPAR